MRLDRGHGEVLGGVPAADDGDAGDDCDDGRFVVRRM